MAKPWEKYASTGTVTDDGPWKKYSASPAIDPAAQDDLSLLDKIGSTAANIVLPPLAFVGRQLDRVTTAPIRAGLGQVQQNRIDRGGRAEGLSKFTDPNEYKDVGTFLGTAIKNFGADPDKSPTAGKIAEGYGVPSTALSDVAPSLYNETGKGIQLKKGGFFDPTASGTVGAIGELAVPIPGMSELKMLGNTAKPIAKMAGEGVEGLARGADLLTGTKAATGSINATKSLIKTTGDAFESARQGITSAFNPKQADDFTHSVKTALENGIDPKLLPEAVEFGKNHMATRTARVQAEGLAGQELLDKHAEGLDQVRKAIHRDIEKIGGSAPVTVQDAGSVLREGFNEGVDRAFDAINTTHKDIIAQVPDLMMDPQQLQKITPKLQDLEAWAKAKSENGLTKTAKEQGNQILNAIDVFKRKGQTYAGSYEALQDIGDVAFKSKNTLADITPDISRFRKLYGDISQAMIGTVENSFGIEKAASLVESNKAMHKIFGDKSLLGKIGQEGTSDEAIFKSIIDHGDTKRITALKDYLSPEQLNTLKGTFLNEMLKGDDFTFKRLKNSMENKKTVASVLFEPTELDNLKNLVNLGDKFGNAVMSTSGTGASNAIREGVKEIGNNILDNTVLGPIKEKARAIGFDISNPLRNAAEGPFKPPTMGLNSPSQSTTLLNKLSVPDFRKKLLRGYANQEQEQ